MGADYYRRKPADGILLYVESKLPPHRNPPRRKKREERRYQWPLTPISIPKPTLLIVILALILIQTNEVTGADGDFLVSPKNQAVIAGDPAQFDCTPQNGEPQFFGWNHDLGDKRKPISSGPTIFSDYIDSVALLISGKTYNLYINSTSTKDALQYGCNTPDPTWTQLAQLLVLDVEPSCTASPDLKDLVEGESFTISCVASYAARWEADITCTDNVDGSALNMDKGSTKGKLDATNTTKNIRADLHDHSYTCQIYFPAPAEGEVPADEPFYKYNREAPSYSFTYTTDILHVQYPVRNLEIQDPKPEYNPSDTITCQAVGRPSPSFQWVDVNTNNIVPGNELLIAASMEGDQKYRCETDNTIRNKVYTANQTINFKVIVPTTTTPKTTTTLQSTEPPTVSVPLPPAGLSGGEIAGIVVGVVAAIALILLIIIFLLLRRRKKPVKEARPMQGRDNMAQVWHSPQLVSPAAEPDLVPPGDFSMSRQGLPAEVAIDNHPRSRKPIQPLKIPEGYVGDYDDDQV